MKKRRLSLPDLKKKMTGKGELNLNNKKFRVIN